MLYRLRARSKGSSVHVLTGTVKDRQSVPFTSFAQAIEHCEKNGWTVLQTIGVDDEGKVFERDYKSKK